MTVIRLSDRIGRLERRLDAPDTRHAADAKLAAARVIDTTDNLDDIEALRAALAQLASRPCR